MFALWRLVLMLVLLGAEQGRSAPADQARSPEESARLMVIADPDLRVELAAAEPLLQSPVAMAWDEFGAFYVAEMSDYPHSTTGGQIRRLTDRDGDGRYEHSTVFAESLPFPNSVLPWNGGLFVTAAPDLWYFKDANGDGVAEIKQRHYTGFGTGNQQLRFNGLVWGVDHWIYGANGRSDGQITWSNAPGPVSLRGRDFRFRPGKPDSFETLAGRSQFGLGMDDWGNRFLSWNTIPLRHEVFPDRWISSRTPALPGDVLSDAMPEGDTGEVYPLTPPPVVFNNESSTHFNALSGLHVYRGDALGPEYRGDAFAGESLLNLVHRRKLVPHGTTFRANRTESKREFLASRDPWFHPVQFATGPDGALYIADFYRKFVEHPDWVAKEMRNNLPWDTGRAYGRIWRVTHRDHSSRSRLVDWPGKATARRLVALLEHPNGWMRDTAQRLLVERRERGVEAALRWLLKEGPDPRAAVHAFHTLAALGALSSQELEAASRSKHPRLREHSLREGLSAQAILERVRDSDPRVRLRALLMAGAIPDAAAREAAIDEAVAAPGTDRWILWAAAMATQRTPVPWLAQLQPAVAIRPAPVPRGADADRERVVAKFKPALAMRGDARRGAELVQGLCFPCHYFQGQGRRVGPDLSALASRPPETLLADVLDPSRQVTPDYQAYEFQLTGGESVTGMISSESTTRITVRHGGGPDLSLARSSILSMRASGRSIMPDGLESGLTVEDMASMLAFLRNPGLNSAP